MSKKDLPELLVEHIAKILALDKSQPLKPTLEQHYAHQVDFWELWMEALEITARLKDNPRYQEILKDDPRCQEIVDFVTEAMRLDGCGAAVEGAARFLHKRRSGAEVQ